MPIHFFLSLLWSISNSTTLQWRHNGHDSVSNHQPHDCLLNRLFRRSSKKTSKLRVTGLCEGNSPVTSEFPAQMASNAENVSIWWRHHDELVISQALCSTCLPLISHCNTRRHRAFLDFDFENISGPASQDLGFECNKGSGYQKPLAIMIKWRRWMWKAIQWCGTTKIIDGIYYGKICPD